MIVCVELFFFCQFRQNKHTCRFKIIVQFPSISDTCVRLSFNSTDRHLSIHFEKAEHHNLTNKNIYWVQYRSDFCFSLFYYFSIFAHWKLVLPTCTARFAIQCWMVIMKSNQYKTGYQFSFSKCVFYYFVNVSFFTENTA